jgi:translation initiation factor IF-2
MANITVGQLAQQTNKNEETLLRQLSSFGIEKSGKDDTLTSEEMKSLLAKINSAKAVPVVAPARKKVTSTVRSDGNHKISVSVKRKRRVAKKTEDTPGTTSTSETTTKDLVAKNVAIPVIEKVIGTVESVEKNVLAPPIKRAIREVKEISVAPKPKDNGFKITSMPTVKVVTNNDSNGHSNSNDTAANKKATKRVFSNVNGSNTKFKREEEDKRDKTKKAVGKGFKKANPRQLSQFAGGGSYEIKNY